MDNVFTWESFWHLKYKVLTYGRRPSVAAEGGKKTDEDASEKHFDSVS